MLGVVSGVGCEFVVLIVVHNDGNVGEGADDTLVWLLVV